MLSVYCNWGLVSVCFFLASSCIIPRYVFFPLNWGLVSFNFCFLYLQSIYFCVVTIREYVQSPHPRIFGCLSRKKRILFFCADFGGISARASFFLRRWRPWVFARKTKKCSYFNSGTVGALKCVLADGNSRESDVFHSPNPQRLRKFVLTARRAKVSFVRLRGLCASGDKRMYGVWLAEVCFLGVEFCGIWIARGLLPF